MAAAPRASLREASSSSPGPRWPAVIAALCLALGALAFDPGAPSEAQGSDGGGTTDLPVGTPVVYEALDGSESLVLTIEEIIDPFEEGLTSHDESRLSEEARRYVALRLRIENTASTDQKLFFPNGIGLLDADTVLNAPSFVGRHDTTTDPKLPTGEILAGATIEGLLFYELPEATQIVAVVFQPSSDRLITLSSRGLQPVLAGPSGEEVSTTEVEAPTPVQPDLADLDSTGSYDSAYFGHRVHWDPDHWRAVAASSSPDGDHLSLEGEVVGIKIDGLRDLDGDARRCLVEQVYADLDEIAGFDAPPDDVEPPTEDGRLRADAGLYLVTPDEDGHPRELVRYVECRTLLAGEAVLRVVVTAPERYWAIDQELVAEVLSAIEMPVWSSQIATADSLAEPSSLPPEVAREVAPLGCGALLQAADVDHALAVWERVHAGEDGDTMGHSGGEVCTEQIASDEAIFVRVEPGAPGDLEPGAQLLGVEGRPIPGLGDEALLFRDIDGDTEAGTSMLSVHEHRDIGDLVFRLTLGRPDLDSPARSLILANLARDVLPRFPGSRVPATAGRRVSLTEALAAEAPDLSNQSFVANLLAKEEAGEWTRGEGLVATLRYLAGEQDASDVLRHEDNLGWEGTGILQMAIEYLERGPDDEAKGEIARLVDLLVWTAPELEAMAGISTPDVAMQFRPVAAGVPAAAGPITPLQRTAWEPMEAIEEACPTYLQQPDASPPCLEWRTVETPPGSDGTYRVFVPSRIDLNHPIPGGWTTEDFDLAVDAVGHSATWLETEGRSLVRWVGGPGKMLDVDVVFTLRWHPLGLASTQAHLRRPGECTVALYTGLLDVDEAQFKQTIAHELVHCFQHANFDPQMYDTKNTNWWTEGTARYLSNVIYPWFDKEWRRESETLRMLGEKVGLLDLSYATWLFWQYLEDEPSIAGIFRELLGLPTSGGRTEQAESLAAAPDMARRFQSFLEAMADGVIEDTDSGRVSKQPADPPVWIIDKAWEGRTRQFVLQPFQGIQVEVHVPECSVATLEVDPDKGQDGARPLDAKGDWGELPTKLPAGPTDRTRLWLASATEDAVVKITVTAVDDDDDDPECEEDDPLAPSSVIDEFCDLGCEPSGYFPPLSPPVDVSDS